MNIAVLLHSSAGGSGVVATELGLCLAKLGHSIHFVADNIPFRLTDLAVGSERVFFHEVQSMVYPLFNTPLTTLAEASKLTEVLEEYRIDIIHAHYAVPHATAALMAKDIIKTCNVCKLPAVVTTLHGTDVTLVGLDKAYLRTTQYAIEKSDIVTAVSDYLANYTREHMGVKRQIKVIPNAIDSERFKPDPPDSNAKLRLRYAHPDEKLLIHISNFRAVKRTSDVVKVFAKVSEQLGARLIMIGDGPERQRCFELVQELQLGGRVSFLGSFPNVEKILAVADLFLLTSSQESFGLVALEAMSSGLPVIASKIGGIPEVVTDGETGFLHALGDVDSMAASALKLLSDKALYQNFSQAARQRAVNVFNERQIVPLYVAAYEEALDSLAVQLS
ncbi:MAG: N-acetyl-alpha-D-glucosaminyl L-malate synthase BshA [Deinococcales bacterium]